MDHNLKSEILLIATEDMIHHVTNTLHLDIRLSTDHRDQFVILNDIKIYVSSVVSDEIISTVLYFYAPNDNIIHLEYTIKIIDYTASKIAEVFNKSYAEIYYMASLAYNK